MIALPRRLAHWEAQLSLFPEDIALVLGPMVARISALMGGACFDQAPAGLPDGFHGISARGSYDRLLASEWLLSDELPDEFLRRAVSGEHLFLERAYQADSAAKQTVALFDAGSDQLGAPRIAQLAILIAMTKRAKDIGATLKWGIIQDNSSVLWTGVTAALVRELLAARCARRATGDDINRWMEIREVQTSSEVWFAGADILADEARNFKASALIISDVIEPGQMSRIHLRAMAPGVSHLREAFLEVPNGAAGAQILRDPFGSDVGGRPRSAGKVDIRSNLVFSVDGRKLFVMGESGTLITFPIPNSPRAKVSPAHAYMPPDGHTVVAVGQTSSKRRTVAVTQGDSGFQVHTLSKRGGAARATEEYNAPDDGLPDLAVPVEMRPLGVLPTKYFFADIEKNLIELTKKEGAVRYKLCAQAERAWPNAFAYVVRSEDMPLIMIARPDKSGEAVFERSVELPVTPPDTRYYFSAYGLCNLVAYSPEESRCVLVHNLKVTELQVPRSAQIIGAMNVGEPIPMLVALSENKRQVEGLRDGNRETLFSTVSPIARIAASDAGLVIAFITEAGEIGIYSCVYKAMLLQSAAGMG